MKPRAVVIMGPTASGKTWLACELAMRYPVHIISADSVMIYRGMDIGSAKPDRGELERFPHALIDIRDPAEAYSAAEFRRDAIAEIEAALGRGQVPVIVGGTSLYFKRLLDGMADMPASTPEVRAGIQAEAERVGWPAMYEQLRSIDPVACQSIHPNNLQRLSRALEVHAISGRPISDHWEAQASDGTSGEVRLADGQLVSFLQFGIMPSDRAWLHEQIALRFDLMLDAGLIEEVKVLLDRGDLHDDMPSVRAVGYAQVWEFLNGHCSHAEMRARGIAATRQLAKRQMTWLRRWPGLQVLEAGPAADQRESMLQSTLSQVADFLQK
ncbi:MAG: tRNA (adenosine(37)-N6)-dimethylallyltransferase MiaA [unclassified Hahellaceae]|nr:tRNA (adenosine(37)-N6)-dimethylallyltransferase MiaA [Hahellaceae bacterium]|tara:strand:- start:66333 stop:67310 length:978 start_codon:yes stop_codon:yes gene_type:complete